MYMHAGMYKYLQYVFYLVQVRIKNAYVQLWTQYVQNTHQHTCITLQFTYVY